MHRYVLAICSVLTATLLFTPYLAFAQTVTTETGNNTSACSGVGDPKGLQVYCEGNFGGFNTNANNTNAQTQIVDPIPGHVSSIKLINYLYAGAPTKFIAAYQPWFCFGGGGSGPYNGTQVCNIANAGSHKVVGYDENNLVPKPGVLAAQHQLMISEGFWAVSPDWYGTSSTQAFINTTVHAEVTDITTHTRNLKLLIMLDGGALTNGTSTLAGCPKSSTVDETTCLTQNIEADLDYIDTNWAENTYYARDASGANLVTFFLHESDWSASNWTTIMDAVTSHIATYHTPMKLLMENNSFGLTGFSGAYAWPQPDGYTNGGTGGYTVAAIPTVAGDCSHGSPGCMQFYWNQTAPPPGSNFQYLEDFYTGASTHSSDVAFGGIWKGFDDHNASWGTNRVIAQQCGQVLLDSFGAINWAHTNLNGGTFSLPYAQVATWNDYEEGTEVETGVDNCYRVQNAAYSQTKDQLTWQLNPVTGQSSYASLSTVHGYTVWKADSTGKLTSIAALGASATSLNSVSKLVGTGTWTLYVEMVGMPLIINRMSTGVAYP
jgi:hypothetical protein